MAYTQVILKEKIPGLGAEADVVKVRSGYARNFLLPQGKAFEATPRNLANTAALKEARAKREAEELIEAEKSAVKLRKLKLTLKLATGANGKAFGSITTTDLAKAIETESGVVTDRHSIVLSKPIKSTGKHDIVVKLHSDVEVELTINVVTEGAAEAAAEAK